MAAARSRTREVEAPSPKSDAYTGLLAISLCAMILGCVLLYLDYSSYPQQKPPPAPALANVRPANASAATQTPPAGGQQPAPTPDAGTQPEKNTPPPNMP
jgi:hypothetical protein